MYPVLLRSIFVICLTAISLGSCVDAKAASYDTGGQALLINEIVSQPSSDYNNDGIVDQNDAYVELLNISSSSVNLSNYQLSSGDVSSGLRLSFFTLQPNTATVLFPQTVNLEAGAHKFNIYPAGGTIKLLDVNATSILDQVQYPPGLTSSESYSRENLMSWLITSPSPGAINPGEFASTPTPAPIATAQATATQATVSGNQESKFISLNEILPDPKSRDWNHDGAVNAYDSWIELYNSNSSSVSLSGYILADNKGSYKLPSGTAIAGSGFLVFFASQTNLLLVSADNIQLYNPDNQLIEEFDFQSSTTLPDTSYSKIKDGGSSWTTGYPPTPGQSNTPQSMQIKSSSQALPSVQLSPIVQISLIKDVRGEQSGTAVTVLGQVTVAAGVLAQDTLVVEDATSGIEIKVPGIQAEMYVEGEWLQITGKIGIESNEPAINVASSNDIVSNGIDLPLSPAPISGDLSSHDGQLVSVTGSCVQTTGDSMILSISNNRINIDIISSTSIQMNNIHSGVSMTVAGVVLHDLSGTSMALFPRTQDDIAITRNVLSSTATSRPAAMSFFNSLMPIVSFLTQRRADLFYCFCGLIFLAYLFFWSIKPQTTQALTAGKEGSEEYSVPLDDLES